MSSFLDGAGLNRILAKIRDAFIKADDTEAVNVVNTAPMNAVAVDSTPTANSNNLVTSGGVKAYVDAHSGGGGGLDAYILTIDSYYINNAIDNDTTAPLTETDWVNLSEAIDAGKIIILRTDTNSHKPGLIGVQSVTLGENYGVPGYAFNDPYYRTGFSPAPMAYVTPYRIYILNDYRNNQFYLKATDW